MRQERISLQTKGRSELALEENQTKPLVDGG